MHLTAGTRVGQYEVESLLGSGGMGEVYRVRDTRLGRSVALKILAPEFTARADSVRRFELEARAASSLNHPHIIHIYDVGEHDTIRYIAMELIEGDTLRRKIGRASFSELIEPLIQVSEALAKAHEAGIVHRDLKPENIMVTPDGYAKVLDFGLAKLMEDRPFTDNSPTAQLQTGSGVLLGTIGYMSPEQVEGKHVDARSDIFSFGCILAEAATGSRPFHGTSMVDTLHKIVHGDPPALTHVPDEIRRVILKCLAKQPADRYQSMREVAAELRTIRKTIDSESSGPTVMLPRLPKRSAAWIAAALLILAILAAVAITVRKTPPPAAATGRVPFQKVDIEKVTFAGDVTSAGIAASGRYVAYTRGEGNNRGLWLRQISTGADVELVHGPPGITYPRFSPDEEFVFYHHPVGNFYDVYKVPSLGGQPRRILTRVSSLVTFAPKAGEMAFVEGTPPAIVPRKGGGSEVIAADLEGRKTHTLYSGPASVSLPAWSPQGDKIACLSVQENHHPVSLSFIDVARHSLSVVRPFHGQMAWYPDGKALIVPQLYPEPAQQIRYVPLPAGEPRRITSDLHHYIGGPTVTSDGRLICAVQLQRSEAISILPQGRDKNARQLTTTVPGKSDGYDMSWIDEQTLAFRSSDRTVNVRTIRVDGTQQKTLASEPYNSRFVISSNLAVSPDRKSIVFASHAEDGIFMTDLDGGSRRRLVAGTALQPSWTSDGRWIVYAAYERFGSGFRSKGIWRVTPDGGTPVPVSADAVGQPMVSADGRVLEVLPDGDEIRFKEYSLEGETVRDLPLVIKGEHGCGWAPNRREIDCVGRDGNLWRHALTGGAARKVTDVDSPIDSWAWSPNGQHLAVARARDSSDVVFIRDRGE